MKLEKDQLLEVLQEKPRNFGIDFGFYCFVEWQATYINLVECVPMLHSDDKNVVSSYETSY